MRLPFLERSPGQDATTYAEAQALHDDGLERELVLSLFAKDADWLAPLLKTAEGVREAVQLEPASYYFEASLKSKFLAAAKPQEPAAVPGRPFRTTVAGLGVAAVGTVMSLLTLGFVTSQQAVPGDWNYTLKRANERVQYTLSASDGRINIQLDHAQARVQEIQVLTSRGEVTTTDIQKLEREARDLNELVKAQVQPLGETQKAKVKVLADTSAAALDAASQVKKSNVEPSVITSASTAVQEVAYAAGVSGVASLTPTATPTALPSPTASSTAAPSTTPTVTTTTTTPPPSSPTSDAKPSATPEPSPSATTPPASSPTVKP